MPLTDKTIRALKLREKPYKVADGHSLYLLVTPNGGLYWRHKYRIGEKEKVHALGVYPTVSLAEARELLTADKKLLQTGKDPAVVRHANKRKLAEANANTFQAIAEELLCKKATRWEPKHAARVRRSLEADVYETLGNRAISEISAADLLQVLRRIEKRGAHEMTSRVLQRCSSVFRYGIVTGRCQYNPAADLKGSLTPGKKRHYAALPASELPEFMQRLASYDGSETTKNAIRLMAMTFVRTGELRGARWNEFDLDGSDPTWRVPADRMKSRMEHIVPLCWQAVQILRQQHMASGDGDLVFPSERHYEHPMSENTILYALYRMGYKSRATGHGFRATASTILNEQGWSPDVIERQLAHAPADAVRAAYNRAQYLPERRRMMQAWGDYLDSLRTGGKVVPINRKSA